MKKNQGFTLIELIIVMIIMGILAVGSVAGFNLLNRNNAKKVAERIQTVLSYIQVENMTKSKNYSMEIIKNASTGEYELSIITTNAALVREVLSTETLELESGEIAFENNAAMQYLISPVPVVGRLVRDKLEVSFRKDTGGVKEYAAGLTVTKILVTSSGKTSSLRLVTSTGKQFIE